LNQAKAGAGILDVTLSTISLTQGDLKECMRVIAPGGYLFLEYPTRYHYKELHTLLPSFEWLPRPLRNGILLALSSRISPLNQPSKERYRSIVKTKLKQISMWQIRYMLMKNGYRPIVLNSMKAAPGIIRCVMQKSHDKEIC
jgi:hypothetical protein